MFRHNKIISLIGLLLIVGCSSLPEVRVGTGLDSPNQNFRVSLAGKGKLVVSQKIANKTSDCDSLKGALSVSMSQDGVGGPIVLDSTCDFQKGTLSVVSRNFLLAGDYSITVRRMTKRAFKENPVVLAKYEDPDFNGGPDYLVDGAKELASGQSIKGTVSYPAGNSTEWIRLKGKNTSAGLTLLENPKAKDLEVKLYDESVGGKTPSLIGTLTSKKKKFVRLRNNNILVKVSAKAYAGAGDYAIVRSDQGGVVGGNGGGNAVKIPVIDCYQVGDNSSVVLLQAVSGVKVNDEVNVYGRKESGENVAIGACQVTSIVGSQASCKMEGAVTGFVEFRAEGKVSG